MILYIALGLEFLLRYMRNMPFRSEAYGVHAGKYFGRAAADSASLELGKPMAGKIMSEDSISSRTSLANATKRERFDQIPYKLRLQIIGLCLSTSFLVVRCVYFCVPLM